MKPEFQPEGEALKGCPFCGSQFVKEDAGCKELPVWYRHPENDCPLSTYSFTAEEINQRAVPASEEMNCQPPPRLAFEHMDGPDSAVDFRQPRSLTDEEHKSLDAFTWQEFHKQSVEDTKDHHLMHPAASPCLSKSPESEPQTDSSSVGESQRDDSLLIDGMRITIHPFKPETAKRIADALEHGKELCDACGEYKYECSCKPTPVDAGAATRWLMTRTKDGAQEIAKESSLATYMRNHWTKEPLYKHPAPAIDSGAVRREFEKMTLVEASENNLEVSKMVGRVLRLQAENDRLRQQLSGRGGR